MPHPWEAMPHRRLGRSGVKVSLLSFGSWVSFGAQLDTGRAKECLAAAWEGGMTFFDNAESYASGQSEQIMGDAIAELGWPRHAFTLSTKFFGGILDGPNTRATLNRKYLSQAIDASLDRLGVDFIDLAFCHRADPDTPIEETVWAMSDMVSAGKVHYWGTSEWTADEIRAAWEIAERHHLHKPVMEQPQYNLFERRRVEKEYARLYEDIGLGTTIWSPLASGLLAGRYLDGVPDDSRLALPGYEWLKKAILNEGQNEQVRSLLPIAEKLDCTLAQLALAWCARNPHVSTVITGASRPEQVLDNLGALRVLPLLTDEVVAEVEAATRRRR